MCRSEWMRSGWLAMAATGVLAMMVSRGGAQETAPAEATGDRSASDQQMVLPGSERMLELRVNAPQEVRVGDEYDYEIVVRNLTNNMVLHDVKIGQHSAAGFQIEKSHKLAAGQTASADQDRTAPKEPGATSSQSQNAGQPDSRKEGGPASPHHAGSSAQAKQGTGEWTISKLEPGEMRRILVTATSDQEGATKTCIAVTSFTRALCLQTQFVKPEIELVKQAPKNVNICDAIRFEYFVKNTGSGPTGRFQIQDKLDEGLITASGSDSLEFPVENLQSGETKKFVAEIRATAAGDFSSRAIATQDNGRSTRSNSTLTQVRAAQLVVAINGPATEYYDRPATYTIRVTNRGDADAEATQLDFYAPASAQLMRTGDPSLSVNRVSDSRGSESARGTARMGRNPANREKARETSQPQPPAGEPAHSWDLAVLRPGQTQTVNVTLRSRKAGTFKPMAIATSACSTNTDQALRETAVMETEIISLPALLVAVVDQEDPVSVGGEVTYNIVVRNQGTAPDQNVKIMAKLPKGLEFVQASGSTEAVANGQELTFEPVRELPPGKRVNWNVRAKVKVEGDVLFQVNLTSNHQKQEVTSEEPTRLIQASN